MAGEDAPVFAAPGCDVPGCEGAVNTASFKICLFRADYSKARKLRQRLQFDIKLFSPEASSVIMMAAFQNVLASASTIFDKMRAPRLYTLSPRRWSAHDGTRETKTLFWKTT
jgi:hypothetical protein